MPKAVAFASLTVCIQAICTEWDKDARGGVEVVQRNRVPEALRLPEFQPLVMPVSYVLHQVCFTALDNFQKPMRENIKIVAYEPVELKGISLALGRDNLAVCYQWDYRQGAPPRQPQKKRVLSLAVGQWGRVCYNGRHAQWESGWYYEKWVYNVGLFHSPTRSIFLTSEPEKVSSHMAHLW